MLHVTIKVSDDTLEYLAGEIFSNFPECSLSLECRRWRYETFDYVFHDHEEGKTYKVDKAKAVEGVKKYLLYILEGGRASNAPPFANVESRDAWEKWLCNCDADDFDAVAQLAVFGEIIYS